MGNRNPIQRLAIRIARSRYSGRLPAAAKP
jgi:hypothetical protein